MQSKKYYSMIGVAFVIIVLAVYYADITFNDVEVPPTTTDIPPTTTEVLPNEKDTIVFLDVQSQAPEFLSYYESITLSPEQEKVKKVVLSSMPAPCCDDPLSTCCCPCNLAKTVWGLSNVLIVEYGYDAEQLEDAVSQWLNFTNPSGYTGVACYEGRCEFPFEQDGCGGMRDLVLGTDR